MLSDLQLGVKNINAVLDIVTENGLVPEFSAPIRNVRISKLHISKSLN